MHQSAFQLNTKPMKSQIEIENQKQRIKRFEAAKQIYNDISYEHNLEYENMKKKKAQRPSYLPQTKEELEERLQEIEKIRNRLYSQKKGIGTAQQNALEEQARKEEEERYAEMERKRIDELAKERYRIALEELHQEENLPFNNSMGNAKKAANERQNYNLHRFIDGKKKKEYPFPPTQSILIPKSRNGITDKTIESKWGQIPVNEEAVRYQKLLEQKEKSQLVSDKQRMKKYKDRSKAAAFRAKCEKLCHDLQDDVNQIRKYEIDVQLTNENLKKTAAEIPMFQTYLVEDRYKKRSEAVSQFLSAPDAPKARKDVPIPIPIHALPNSPVQSDEEYRYIVNDDDFAEEEQE